MVLSRHAEKLLGRTEDGIFEGPRVKSWFHIETVTLKGMFLLYSACQMACIDDFIEVALLHILICTDTCIQNCSWALLVQKSQSSWPARESSRRELISVPRLHIHRPKRFAGKCRNMNCRAIWNCIFQLLVLQVHLRPPVAGPKMNDP